MFAYSISFLRALPCSLSISFKKYSALKGCILLKLSVDMKLIFFNPCLPLSLFLPSPFNLIYFLRFLCFMLEVLFNCLMIFESNLYIYSNILKADRKVNI